MELAVTIAGVWTLTILSLMWHSATRSTLGGVIFIISYILGCTALFYVVLPEIEKLIISGS